MLTLRVGDTRGIERMHCVSGIGLSLTLGLSSRSYLAGVNMKVKKVFWMPFQKFIKHG